MLNVFNDCAIQEYILLRNVHISADVSLIVAGRADFLLHLEWVLYKHNLNHCPAPFGL